MPATKTEIVQCPDCESTSFQIHRAQGALTFVCVHCGRAADEVRAEPHFITHRLTGQPWCVCPCPGCGGHVEGLEGTDCTCGGCSCSATE